jgi:exopolysaccharide biosynthesis polyprenyl glycosylphosphotransferase
VALPERSDGVSPERVAGARPSEDARSAKPYLLTGAPFHTLIRRGASVLALATVDIGGLIIGLYAALAVRAFVVDPHPVLWGLIWDQETSWLAFLILVLVLVFWRAGLYARRELREGVGRVVGAVFLVAALSLAFAVGSGQHVTTLGLYVVGALFVSAAIALFRASYELLTGEILRAAGVRRRAVLVGTPAQRDRLRSGLGAAQAGIEYSFVGELDPAASDDEIFADDDLDDVIVADMGISEERLLEIVDAAHRRAVKVRIAPRTTELLVERGEYVPGLGVPLFELRPPIFAGADWTLKRSFDIVVSALIVVIGLPIWAAIAVAIKLTSRGPVFYADPRVGLGEQEFRMLKFRTMVADADRQQEELERANEATGALFKIRRDPRVTSVGRVLRRLSLDEVPNVINVLRGEMSLVGPRPLPVRDYERLEGWHRRRYNVLPGITGLWQIGGRSDLEFDDLVRLDFYYLENWSIWLDISILFRTPAAILSRRGAY